MKSPRLLATKAARPFLFVLGWILLAIGAAGLVLPLLPGTVLLIGAAACFARSSPRFENWLLTHPKLGPAIANWRQHGIIPVRAKILAASAMALSLGLLLASAAPLIAKTLSAALIAMAALYVLTRPSTPR